MKRTSAFLKAFSLLMVIVLLCCAVIGCRETINGEDLTDTDVDKETLRPSVQAPIPLSGFEDVTDEDGKCAYQMIAEFSDTYVFECENAVRLSVETPEDILDGETRVEAAIREGDTVIIRVEAEKKNRKVSVVVTPQEHERRLPYQPAFTVDPDTLDLTGESVTPGAATLEYQKREGGTYVYLNNPEKLQPDDVGQAILRNEGLSGDVQVTWEHSNYTGKYIYLGYQLKNEGDEDVYVTVTNIGLQNTGEWLGQRSWSDYYNQYFELPEDYFTDDTHTVVSQRYQGQDFIDYDPRIFQPKTYRIPAGEYIYVLGGTSADAWNNTSVADTADVMLLPGRCSNAVAKFFVTGGTVTGTFYCYENAEDIQEVSDQQGYITLRDGTQFGLQYKGVDHHTALIENNPVFYVDDSTPSGSLPVTFTQSYDEHARFRRPGAYGAFENDTYTYEGRYWATNINAQAGGAAVGTDMSSFECVTTNGNTVTIDVDHADCTGDPANLGNWMIDYHDNITIVNQGDTARTFTINKSAQGALMAMVMDPEGNVLATRCTIVPLEESRDERHWKLYEVTVEPHSYVQLSVSFLLMGNSYGNVGHWITVD